MNHLISNSDKNNEIIVVDGESTDETISIVNDYEVRLLHAKTHRALQMNIGASTAVNDCLYFVHADTLPPIDFQEGIEASFKAGFEACCYRTRFENRRGLMRLNEFHSRYLRLYFRGGDQSLAIKKDLFNELNCFEEEMSIMEEYPLLEKLMARKKFQVIPADILISSRKYAQNSWMKVTRANLRAYRMYKKGKDTDQIKRFYQEKLQLNS